MADLLFEVLSEEIPAGMQQRAAQGLHDLVVKALADQRIAPAASACDATPRRLLVTLSGLPGRQEDLEEERKGPRVGAPEGAIQGFLKSAGLTSLDQAKVVADKKGDIYVAHIHRAGRVTPEVVADLLPPLIRAFPWPKSMRWGRGSPRSGTICGPLGAACGISSIRSPPSSRRASVRTRVAAPRATSSSSSTRRKPRRAG